MLSGRLSWSRHVRALVSGKIGSKRRTPIRTRRRMMAVEIVEQRCLLSATDFIVNEVQADPDATEGDANNDGVVNTSQDEFVELVNNSATAMDIGGWTLSDGAALRHTFDAGTVVDAGQAVVLFGGGTPTGTFGGSIVATASSGSLGLNNGGDTVTLSDGTVSLELVFGGSSGTPSSGDNQALTRDPDLTGAFALHTTLPSGIRYSPGFKNDGITPFITTPLEVTQSDSSTNVTEGGATDSIDIALTGSPTANVVVTLTPADGDIDLGSGAGVDHVLTFTPGDANTAQTVTVTATDDADIEGTHTSSISFATTSGDAGYDGLSAVPVTVNITDNDTGTAAALVINEIDYDNVGSDNAEFVEILNTGATAVDLNLYELRLINGSGGSVYTTIDLPAVSLAAGDYFVIGAAGVANVDLEFGAATNNLQNGAPDGVALFFDGSTLVDTVSYEGEIAGFVEGVGGATADSNSVAGSISRIPDGVDTDNNAADFQFVASTPGAANAAATPEFAIAADASAVQAEGTGGTTNFTFTVTRSGDTSGINAVDFAVTAAATDGVDANDFSPAGLPAGTLTFAASETTMTITVVVNGDTDIEADEGLVVTLANATAGALITTSTANGTIQNDDAADPEFAILATDANLPEGQSGSTPFTYTVTRTGVTTGEDTLDYAVTVPAGGADAADFVGAVLPSGQLVFADGETSKTITINVQGDGDIEPNEAFTVNLSVAATSRTATVDPAAADGTIQDDDTPAANAWINEFHYDNSGGDVGEFVEVAGAAGIDLTGYQVIQYNGNGGVEYGSITLSGVIDDEASSGFGAVSFVPTAAFQNGNDGFALVDNIGRVLDFVSYEGAFEATDGPAAGMTAVDVGVSESSSSPQGVSLQRDNAGTPDITNVWKGPFDDTPGDLNVIPGASLVIVATDAVKDEGNTGTTTFLFTVTRSGDTTGVVDVDFAVTGAVDALDFDGAVLPSGTVNFVDGDSTETIVIVVAGDTDIEADEDFTVTLSNATGGATIDTATADGTIQNDDAAAAALTVVIDQASISENGGAGTGTVSLPANATADLEVTLVSDDTGEAIVSSPITITAGTSSTTFTITGQDDLILDGTQLVTITATAAGFTDGEDTVEVLDDEVEASALLINEIMIDPPESSDTGHEFFELRGTPNGFLPGDTYLVLLEGDSDSSPGNIDHVFTLGGMQFSSTGYLSFTQTAGGWDQAFSSRSTDFENGSVSFLLVQAATAPVADTDVDDDDNGVLNNNDNGWTIHDAIGNIDGGADDTAYGFINVSGNGNGKTPAGSTFVGIPDQPLQNGLYHPDYVARNGDSTGSALADWVFAEADPTSPNYTLAVGATVPSHLGGAPIDHPGSTNIFTPPQALFVDITPTSLNESGGTTTTTATVSRNAADISAELTVTIVSDSGRASVTPTTVTIAAGAASATFSIDAVNNGVVDGTETVTISATSTDYAAGTDTVDIIDDDSQSLVVAPVSVTVPEGGSNTFAVSLGAEPVGSVSVTLGTTGDADLTVGSATLTFDNTNWNTPQDVTINAAEDADTDDGTATITVASSGLTSVEVTATEDDNDSAAAAKFDITEAFAGLPGEDGTSEWFEITNTGTLAGNINSLFYEDNSDNPAFGVQLPDFDLGIGESVIVLNSNSNAAIGVFESVWGVGPNIVVFPTNAGPGMNDGGDTINLYDANTAGANLVEFVVYDGAADQETYEFDVAGTQSLSAVGVNGAYTSAEFFNDNVGDPDNMISMVGSPFDPAAPLVSTLTPADDATSASVANDLLVEFNEPILAGTGNVEIRLTSDDSLVESIDVTSGQVTISGATVAINPAADFAAGTGYYVQVSATAFTDLSANAFVGIADATTWDFTTAAGPEIQVEGLGLEIVDGDVTPDVTDDTLFGGVTTPAGSMVHTFTVRNLGAADLDVSTVTVTTGDTTEFTIANFTAGAVAAGGSLTFDVVFDPTSDGIKTATVSITNDDADENPYTFDVQGVGFTAADIAITEFINNPGGSDGTDEWIELYNFGSTSVDLTDFTVSDEGSDSFTLGSVTIAANDFVILAVDKVAFETQWLGGVADARVVDYAGMALSNSGDELVLSDAAGNVIYNIAWTNDEANGQATYLTDDTFTRRDWGTEAGAKINRNGDDLGITDLTGYEGSAAETGSVTSTTGDLGTPFSSSLLPALTVTIATSSISEDDGVAAGVVTRTGDTTGPLVVMLTNSDLSEATLPASVMILAGDSSANFIIQAEDDTVVDGTQTVTVTGEATGFVSGSADVDVTDNDSATVSIAAVTNGNELDPTDGQFVVSVTTASEDDVDVTYIITGSAISGTDFTALTGTVTIPANTLSAAIDIDVIDDEVAETVDTLTIQLDSVFATGDVTVDMPQNTDSILMLDDDIPDISLSTTTVTVSEDGSTATVEVQLTSQPTANVILTVTTADATEATVSTATLTFTPADWDTAQTLVITGIEDGGAVDGTQDVDVEVSVDVGLSASEYHNVPVAVVNVKNEDNDAAAVARLEDVTFYNTDAGIEDGLSLEQNGQRSLIRHIQVVIDGTPTIPTGAVSGGTFALLNQTTSASVGLTVDSATVVGSRTIVVLSFTSGTDAGGSLVDGRYEFTTNGGSLFDADGSGALGGTQVLTFHRLFGDSDGDGDVDGRDRVNLIRGFRGLDPRYVSVFDFNDNGNLRDDLAEFFARYGRRI